VINVGSPTHCSKYDFGQQLAETFGFNQSLISKGSMKQHPFSAKRNPKLDLNCTPLVGLKLQIPKWEDSIALFAKKKKHIK